MELENNAGSWAQRSDSIINIAKALCQAQAMIEAVKKDASNPFFKSKYADLASIWHTIREPLTSNGLCVLQEPSTEGNKVRITTTLMHVSGEYVRSSLEVSAVKIDPQGIGSAITYARRYALSPIIGIAPEDDDGNAASGGGDRNNKRQEPQKIIPSLKSADQMQAEATSKTFGNDDLSFNSNGKPDMATAQIVKKSTVYHYDLKTYFESLKPSQANAATRLLEKAQGYDMGNDLWAVPEFVEGLKQFIVADQAGEQAA